MATEVRSGSVEGRIGLLAERRRGDGSVLDVAADGWMLEQLPG